MDVINIYEIFGIVVTTIGAVFTFLKSIEGHKAINTLVVSLLGVVITMLVSMRFSILPDMRGDLKVATDLKSNPKTADIVPDLIQVENILKTNNNELMDYILDVRFNSFKNDLRNAIDQEFVVRESEMPEFALRMIRTAKTEIYATSFVLVNEWWLTPWGKKYEDANLEAIKRGIKIHRIFIFKDNKDFQNTKAILSRQRKANIDVKYVFVNELDAEFQSDIIVIDNTLGGKLELTGQHSMQQATFFKSRNKIDGLNRTFKSVEAQSQEVNF